MISACVSFRYLPYCDEILGHLQRQFARRLQDQAARHTRAGARTGQDIEHRQGEAGGLAGAGLGRAHHVTAHQDDRGSPVPGSASDGGSPCRRSRAAHPRTGRGRRTGRAPVPAAALRRSGSGMVACHLRRRLHRPCARRSSSEAAAAGSNRDISGWVTAASGAAVSCSTGVGCGGVSGVASVVLVAISVTGGSTPVGSREAVVVSVKSGSVGWIGAFLQAVLARAARMGRTDSLTRVTPTRCPASAHVPRGVSGLRRQKSRIGGCGHGAIVSGVYSVCGRLICVVHRSQSKSRANSYEMIRLDQVRGRVHVKEWVDRICFPFDDRA